MSTFVPPALPANPPPTPPASLVDFQYHSQYAQDMIGVVINVGGVPTNVDANAMTVAMYPVAAPGTSTVPNPPGAVFSRGAIQAATGVYETTFLTGETANPGFYRIDWSFNLNGVPELISTYIQVGQVAPAYDGLPADMKQIVEDVWVKFADGFDSPFGGPNLQMWFNTRFGRGRIAQLLRQAIQHLNNVAQPQGNFTADGVGGPEFDLIHWSGLLNTALTVEVLKHLIRSYTEDPDIVGNVDARVTRRDYMTRWQTNLSLELPDFERQMEVWKMSLMFAGQPRVLVSGGVFGNFGPTRLAGAAAARPRYWTRWYVFVLALGIGVGGVLRSRPSVLRTSNVAVVEVAHTPYHLADALPSYTVFSG